MSLFGKLDIDTVPTLSQFYQLAVPHVMPSHVTVSREGGPPVNELNWSSSLHYQAAIKTLSRDTLCAAFEDSELDRWLFHRVARARVENFDGISTYIEYAARFPDRFDADSAATGIDCALSQMVLLSELHEPLTFLMDAVADDQRPTSQIQEIKLGHIVQRQLIVPVFQWEPGQKPSIASNAQAFPGFREWTVFLLIEDLLNDFLNAVREKTLVRCEECRSVYVVRAGNQKFCSDRCFNTNRTRRYRAKKKSEQIAAQGVQVLQNAV